VRGVPPDHVQRIGRATEWRAHLPPLRGPPLYCSMTLSAPIACFRSAEYCFAASSGLESPLATRPVAFWIAVVILLRFGSGGRNFAFSCDFVESTRYCWALNSATSAESLRATGCGSSIL